MARKSTETTVEPFDVRKRTTAELLSMIAGRPVEWSSGVSEISRMTVSEISRNLKVDPEGARRIQASLELLGRELVLPRNIRIRAGNDVADYFRARLSGYDRESFWTLTLDQKHHPIDCHQISEGTLSMTPVHPREAFSKVIRDSAAAVIFIHNHPSGDPSPSEEDVSLTRRLCECGAILGIRVLDHIVVGREGFASLRDMGLVPDNQNRAAMAAESVHEEALVDSQGLLEDSMVSEQKIPEPGM